MPPQGARQTYPLLGVAQGLALWARIFTPKLAAMFFTAVMGGILFLSSQAQASCIYNKTTYPMNAEWQEGWGFSQIIGPSNKKCINAKGGDVHLWILKPDRKQRQSTKAKMNVDNHGWISVGRLSDGVWTAKSKKSSGKVKQTKKMKPCTEENVLEWPPNPAMDNTVCK